MIWPFLPGVKAPEALTGPETCVFFGSDGTLPPLFWRSEAPYEGLGAGRQPTLLDDLAAVLVDEAQVRIPVAEVQSGRRLRLVFANIHGGPILLPFWASEPAEQLQTL